MENLRFATKNIPDNVLFKLKPNKSRIHLWKSRFFNELEPINEKWIDEMT
jgi:hypothetical protein